MNYKVAGALRRNRTSLIIILILWVVFTLIAVVPFVNSYHVAAANGFPDIGTFSSTFVQSLKNPFAAIGNIIKNGMTDDFFSSWLIFSIFYVAFAFVGLIKSAPKNEYTDIEHGSSDWSQRGEQYQILNRNKGIVLAENNYLPVDKRGNVNVLVVGRIRIW